MIFIIKMRHSIQRINSPSKIPFQTQNHKRTSFYTSFQTTRNPRYLETTHVKLDEIPFFEKRAEALNWRRFRAEKWEEVQYLD